MHSRERFRTLQTLPKELKGGDKIENSISTLLWLRGSQHLPDASGTTKAKRGGVRSHPASNASTD